MTMKPVFLHKIFIAALVALLLAWATPAAATIDGERPTVGLDLDRAIKMAADSSLASFRFRNLYMAGFGNIAHSGQTVSPASTSTSPLPLLPRHHIPLRL